MDQHDYESHDALLALLEAIHNPDHDLDEKNLPDTGALAPIDWFIGPKASALKPLEDALKTGLDTHIAARKDYYPDDPKLPRDKHGSAEYETQSAYLKHRVNHLAKMLKGSVPLASYRNQSHMYWDISTPAIAGYFSGMLYNQNNVAAEASR